MKPLLSLAFACLLMSVSVRADSVPSLSLGSSAPGFNLPGVDGRNWALKDFSAANLLVVVFTCNHCPFAKAYENRIMELDKKYAAKGFPVIAINPNDVSIVPEDSYENMIARSKEKGYTFPYLYDESQEIAKAYGAVRTPHVFILQKEGEKMIVKYIGAIDNNSDEPEKADQKYVEDAINALLAGKGISVAETKAIGCGIKWK